MGCPFGDVSEVVLVVLSVGSEGGRTVLEQGEGMDNDIESGGPLPSKEQQTVIDRRGLMWVVDGRLEMERRRKNVWQFVCEDIRRSQPSGFVPTSPCPYAVTWDQHLINCGG